MENHKNAPADRIPEEYMGLGIALGLIFGAALGNVGLGLILGVLLGSVLHSLELHAAAKRDTPQPGPADTPGDDQPR